MADYQEDIDQCLYVLNAGGVILYPTDTVWGLGCDATNANAVSKIFSIKKRSEAKSLIVLLANMQELTKYTGQDILPIELFLNQTSDPVTVIYEGAKNLASNAIHQDGTVGIRITKDPFCQDLIKAFGKPIVSTSANLSGNTTPAIFAEVEESIKKQVDYAVKYRQGENTRNQPSRIVKLSGTGELIFLR